MKRLVVLALLSALVGAAAQAGESTGTGEPVSATTAQPAAPPLPFHSVEGMGGAFAVPSAYLVNPGPAGAAFGPPAFGYMHVGLGHGRTLDAFTITETLYDRIELGYGFDTFNIGDLAQDVEHATGMVIGEDAINMHNFNARVQLVKEGAFDRKWTPAVTAGVSYKYNANVDDVDTDLAGTLSAIGIEHKDGVDYTLFLSKMLTFLPRPVIVTAGARSTKAAHIGLLGFADDREIVFEGSVCAFLTDRALVAVEYRQKPDEYTPIPGLVARENDWWTICFGYVINEHATIAAGYAHFGDVLNHEANCSWGVAFKYEL